MVEAVNRALRVVHEDAQGNSVDPRDEIWKALGDLPDKLRIGGDDILICRYVRSGRVKSSAGIAGAGLLLPDQVKDNDKWLQNTGLIIKMGPLAYRTEKTHRWFVDSDGEALPPRIGDWVMFDPALGKPFHLGERICFLVPAQYVFLVIDEPDIIQ